MNCQSQNPVAELSEYGSAGAEQGSCGRRQEEGVENMRGQHFILNSDQSPMLLFLSATSTSKAGERKSIAQNTLEYTLFMFSGCCLCLAVLATILKRHIPRKLMLRDASKNYMSLTTLGSELST